MKVIYDISTVGNRPEARTGVARVAWTMASLLHEKLGDNVGFSASGSISAALQAEDLLSHHVELRSAIHPVGTVARYVYKCQEKLGKSQKQYIAISQLLTNFSRLLNITRRPINSRLLQEADIFHSPYARIPMQVRKALPARHVLTVNDLTPLLLDEHLFAPGQKVITQRMIDSVQSNDWVITISDSTRNDLCNYRSLNSERVITVHLAASEDLFYPVDNFDIIYKAQQKYKFPPGRYLLTLHSLAPHKNLSHLINSFQKLIKQEKIEDLTLVICGGQGRSTNEILKSLNLAQSDLMQVYFTGYVEDEDLAALYSGALAFVFPSLYEGFGLPVLEAMQCGCPVIASNSSSLPEIVGKAGILITPDDKNELSEAMLRLYQAESLRHKLSTASKQRANQFNWERTFTETLGVYKRVLNKS